MSVLLSQSVSPSPSRCVYMSVVYASFLLTAIDSSVPFSRSHIYVLIPQFIYLLSLPFRLAP